jgi:hypothetical protein
MENDAPVVGPDAPIADFEMNKTGHCDGRTGIGQSPVRAQSDRSRQATRESRFRQT